MVAYKKNNAFLKFFLTYFISVAMLILSSGYFYFEQMQSQLLKAQHFSLIEYARHIKMGEDLSKFSNDFHYEFVQKKRHIVISNFKVTQKEFIKYIPTKKPFYYLKVYKSKKIFEQKRHQLRIKIITIQIILLFIFALISYVLAKNALKPLQESITTLDNFAKDLIHDLNTPLTAMSLNLKILQKDPHCSKTKALQRLQKSIQTILDLRFSLTTLLEEKTFQIEKTNICTIIKDVIELHQINYSHLDFIIECDFMEVEANPKALQQILHNLISNACKYNKPNGFVHIYTKEKKLFIEDSGVGINEVEKIFQRSYSGHNSTGFGLDIVKRLCDAMDINIEVISSKKGSCFILEFN